MTNCFCVLLMVFFLELWYGDHILLANSKFDLTSAEYNSLVISLSKQKDCLRTKFRTPFALLWMNSVCIKIQFCAQNDSKIANFINSIYYFAINHVLNSMKLTAHLSFERTRHNIITFHLYDSYSLSQAIDWQTSRPIEKNCADY